ncbi:hypothetical protein [Oceanithermus sp.]|uniref:hypothetical protein n=1 Tax=Oceanithermus sp. TaxID=2268145 RepID=UPI0025796D77|nr:hypothetical protein [Oceanithermus sp.]
MLKERPIQALLRGSHQNKPEEIKRRRRLLGAHEDEGLVSAALRRRRGEVTIALVNRNRLEFAFKALEVDGELHPWLAVVDLVEKPGGLCCEELDQALRRWLREFRKNPEAKLVVRGQVIRLAPVTAYPIGR